MTINTRYELHFSRRFGHAFLSISTYVMNNGKIMHSHTAHIDGEYDFERVEMWKEFCRFRKEEANYTETYYREFDGFKTITISKTWEG